MKYLKTLMYRRNMNHPTERDMTGTPNTRYYMPERIECSDGILEKMSDGTVYLVRANGQRVKVRTKGGKDVSPK